MLQQYNKSNNNTIIYSNNNNNNNNKKNKLYERDTYMNFMKKLKKLLSRVYLIKYFKNKNLFSSTPAPSSSSSNASTSYSHLINQNEMLKNNSNNFLLIKFLLSEFLMFVCNFCEIFLLILILLYAFFQSFWILVFIAAGILGKTEYI